MPKKTSWSIEKMIGTTFMTIGASLLIVSTGTIPMSVITVGPIMVSGLSEQRTSMMIVGVIFIVLGYAIFNGFKKFLKLFNR